MVLGVNGVATDVFANRRALIFKLVVVVFLVVVKALLEEVAVIDSTNVQEVGGVGVQLGVELSFLSVHVGVLDCCFHPVFAELGISRFLTFARQVHGF